MRCSNGLFDNLGIVKHLILFYNGCARRNVTTSPICRSHLSVFHSFLEVLYPVNTLVSDSRPAFAIAIWLSNYDYINIFLRGCVNPATPHIMIKINLYSINFWFSLGALCIWSNCHSCIFIVMQSASFSLTHDQSTRKIISVLCIYALNRYIALRPRRG